MSEVVNMFEANFYYAFKNVPSCMYSVDAQCLLCIKGTTCITIHQITNDEDNVGKSFIDELSCMFLSKLDEQKITLPEQMVNDINIFQYKDTIYLMLWLGLYTPKIIQSKSETLRVSNHIDIMNSSDKIIEFYILELGLESVMWINSTKMYLTLLNRILHMWNKKQLARLNKDSYMCITLADREPHEILKYTYTIHKRSEDCSHREDHHTIKMINQYDHTIIYVPTHQWVHQNVLLEHNLIYAN